MPTPAPTPRLCPTPGKLYLRRCDPPETAASSVFALPDSVHEKSVEAVVVGIPDIPTYEWGREIPCPARVGDRVLVGKYAGDHKFRNQTVTIVRFDEVLARIEEPVPEDGKTGVVGPVGTAIGTLLPSLPSAADLDAIAAEQVAADQTKGTAE